jgi:hypothetical protein
MMLASNSSVLHGSKVVRSARRALADSAVVERVRGAIRRAKAVPGTTDAWVRNATVTSKLAVLGHAVEGSGVARASREGTEWARASFLCRWLTKEPEPDVVVIDLRETLSVGPIIALLDRVLRFIVPHWAQSIPGRVLGGLVDLGERLADTRGGRLLVAVLEPPEPPDGIDESPESERDGRGDDER